MLDNVGFDNVDFDNVLRDVWFSFVASGNELDLGITSGLGGVSVGIYSGLNCNTMTPIFCGNSNSGNLTETFTPLSPGTTYFIQVSGEDEADQSAFNLSLNNKPINFPLGLSKL